MGKQQNAPILTPIINPQGMTDPVWQKWFQKLKTADDEIKKPPGTIYTEAANISTASLGEIVLFNIGAVDVTANLPAIEKKDLWAWLTVVRMGSGILTLTADEDNRIEYGSYGGSMYCEETKRRAANVTLQIVTEDTWAIIAGLGTWQVD